MRAAGLCHSDLSVIDGNRPRPLPMVLGHEMAGVVEQVGAGVTDLQRGDHVVAAFVPSCGALRALRRGPAGALRAGLRGQHRRHAAVRLAPAARTREATCNHHLGVSGFADHAVLARELAGARDPRPAVRRSRAFRLRGHHRRRRRGEHGRDAAWLDASRSSASAASASPRCSPRACSRPRTIVAIDMNDAKLAVAREFGATATVNAADPQCRRAGPRPDRGRRGLRVRDGRSGARARTRVPHHAPRRHDRDRRPVASRSSGSACRTSSLVAEERTLKGSYLGSCVPSARHPALHRVVSGRDDCR